MIEAAIECIIRIMYEENKWPKKVTVDRVAQQVGDKFGFVQGRDFTRSDIERLMSKYN